jgi:subtilisin family serine protease
VGVNVYVIDSGIRADHCELGGWVLGGASFVTANLAVENLVAAGIPVVVAAGSYDTDACNYSPASAEAALTIGATNAFDTRADFSNWGGCVDLFAPPPENKSPRRCIPPIVL